MIELTVKSNENKIVAEWAEGKKYYHVSVSRFYYSLYQKLLHINIVKKLGVKKKYGGYSHYDFVTDCMTALSGRMTDEEIAWISQMRDLRKIRDDAEYSDKEFENKFYNLGFKYPYMNIDNVLNRFLSGR